MSSHLYLDQENDRLSGAITRTVGDTDTQSNDPVYNSHRRQQNNTSRLNESSASNDSSSNNNTSTVNGVEVTDSSRKRDSNWNKDEVVCLLNSIKEITHSKRSDGRKRSSREIFEYSAKKMIEKGFPVRGDREKCRTKWKKLKEELSLAKRARIRDGPNAKIPIGIVPFFTMLDEMINRDYHHISPNSTIVRRSQSNNRETRHSIPRPSQIQQQRSSSAFTNGELDQGNNQETPPNVNQNDLDQEDMVHLGSYTSSNNPTNNSHSQQQSGGSIHDYNSSAMINNIDANGSMMDISGQACDISYRVSNGYRQITIFGDHDVDIKFRGDCVTINKLIEEYIGS